MASSGGGNRSICNDATSINSRNNDTTPTDMIAKKRSFTQKLAIQRQVFHEMTSFRKFPLQDMAIRDVEENLKDYLAAATTAADAASGDDVVSTAHSDSDDSEDGQRRQKEVSPVATAKTSPKQLQQTCQEEHTWREQFTKEFLQEKSMPVVVMTNNDHTVQPSSNFTDAVPTLTQEMENFLPFLDAAIERHFDGYETNSSSTDRSAEHSVETCSQTNDKENILDNNAKQSCVTFEEIDDCQQTGKDMATSSIFIFDDDDDDDDDEEHVGNDTQNTSQLPVLWSFEPRLFAMETALHGKRRYISAHLGRFMDYYWRECDVHNRHYYELIRESTPCRLYFDLEFNKQYNPHLTTTMTEDLLTELFEEIQHQFQLFYSISLQRSNMVDLDSSTAKKFSRHWIMHLPGGLLFDDARAAGIFVKAMVSRLEKERKSGVLQAKGRCLLADNLFVNAEEATDENVSPKLTCIIDLGVYTRNRLFRLLGSKKFGKSCDATLRIAKTNEFLFPKQFDNSGRMTTVETHSASDARETGSDVASFEKFCNSMSWEAHAEALAATLVVPANSGKIKFPTLPHPIELLDEDEQAQLCITPRCGGGSRVQRGSPEYGESPFPKLDNFIVNTLGKRENLVGNIGTWTLDYMLQPLPQIICYNMRDNRYCENVARAHKSNNIIWNVHLIDRVCFQTCHDPECRAAQFRGEALNLPEDVNTEIDEFFLEYELSTLNEGIVIESNSENGNKASDDFDDPELEQAMLQLNIEEKKVDDVDKDDDGPKSHAVVESADPWGDDDKLDSELLEVAKNLPQVFS
ncbi:UL52/UL70 DNA primase domain-containing protein [Skeletonema marinoi]|uniref:DNA-directed primase/polymerase protein n=1 Tax=Skeletonema marinoi TaxID=267567 RepID=A0AAD9D800_9STRA|nr:UL52/UL70 DNA primase domain-containing protein [Skeletonema marinoi]